MVLFTARKRSLGQGNIFISVCQEFCSRGGVHGPRGVCSRGVHGGDPPRRLLLWAVRILLECILFSYILCIMSFTLKRIIVHFWGKMLTE